MDKADEHLKAVKKGLEMGLPSHDMENIFRAARATIESMGDSPLKAVYSSRLNMLGNQWLLQQGVR